MNSNTNQAKIMGHMIPFFPDAATSSEVAKALVDGGAAYLEIQFPFSDPTADGPVIEAACSQALSQGFTVDKGFSFVREAARLGRPVFVMTYASLVFRRGVDRFCREAAEAGAAGLIVPDLPADSDEGLARECARNELSAVPVLVPTSTDARMKLLLESEPEYVYCALRTGITGSKTELGKGNADFLKRVRSYCDAYGGKIVAGFGIQEAGQVAVLQPQVHAVVVGSALVRIISDAWESRKAVGEAVETFLASLLLAK